VIATVNVTVIMMNLNTVLAGTLNLLMVNANADIITNMKKKNVVAADMAKVKAVDVATPTIRNKYV
jgi:hypothetical protein